MTRKELDNIKKLLLYQYFNFVDYKNERYYYDNLFSDCDIDGLPIIVGYGYLDDDTIQDDEKLPLYWITWRDHEYDWDIDWDNPISVIRNEAVI